MKLRGKEEEEVVVEEINRVVVVQVAGNIILLATKHSCGRQWRTIVVVVYCCS